MRVPGSSRDFHAINRSAQDHGRQNLANIRKEWDDASTAFKLIDVAAEINHPIKEFVSKFILKNCAIMWKGPFEASIELSPGEVHEALVFSRP